MVRAPAPPRPDQLRLAQTTGPGARPHKREAQNPRNDAIICNVSVSSDGNCIIAVDSAGTIYEGQRGSGCFYWHKIPVPTDCPELGDA